jgi:hypothetical protein
LLGVGGSDAGHDLLRGEDVDLGTRRGARLLDVGDRILGQLVERAGSPHGAVEDRDDLLSDSIDEDAIRMERRRPPLHLVGREVLEEHGAESWADVVAEHRVVVAERGGRPLAVSLEVAEVFVERLVDRDARSDHSGKAAFSSLDEDLAKPRLCRALREVAGRWAATVSPGWADRLLDLAAVGQAVLGSPDRAALALDSEDVA